MPGKEIEPYKPGQITRWERAKQRALARKEPASRVIGGALGAGVGVVAPVVFATDPSAFFLGGCAVVGAAIGNYIPLLFAGAAGLVRHGRLSDRERAASAETERDDATRSLNETREQLAAVSGGDPVPVTVEKLDEGVDYSNGERLFRLRVVNVGDRTGEYRVKVRDLEGTDQVGGAERNFSLGWRHNANRFVVAIDPEDDSWIDVGSLLRLPAALPDDVERWQPRVLFFVLAHEGQPITKEPAPILGIQGPQSLAQQSARALVRITHHPSGKSVWEGWLRFGYKFDVGADGYLPVWEIEG